MIKSITLLLENVTEKIPYNQETPDVKKGCVMEGVKMTEKITIAPGTRVEIELTARDKTRETLQCMLVNDDAADFAKGLLSVNTPLAKTILGHTAGETLAYAQGDIVQIRILSVQLAPDAVAADAGEQRDETLRRARDKAELASMVSFALTFDSKWGDYDPEQIVKQYEENQDKKKEDEK